MASDVSRCRWTHVSRGKLLHAPYAMVRPLSAPSTWRVVQVERPVDSVPLAPAPPVGDILTTDQSDAGSAGIRNGILARDQSDAGSA
eukprot:8954576-Pyramimonas_sp.AAC.1